MNRNSVYKVAFGILFGVLIAVLLFNSSLHPKVSMNGKDVWEYHTIGVNYAEFGKFPVMGFLGEPELYELDKLKPNAIDDYILCRFTQNGSVHHLEKPPVYGLLLGITYSVLGISIENTYFLNCLFFIGILVNLFFIGKSTRHQFGPILGLITCIVYSLSDNHHLADVLPSTLMVFLACCITLVSVLLLQRFTLFRFIVLGALLAIAPLTNGNLIFIVIFTPPLLYVASHAHPKKRLLFVVMALSFSAILLPWMVFANALRIDNTQSWIEWKNGIAETENQCVVDTSNFNEWESAKQEILVNGEHIKLISHMYMRCANQQGFVIFSNQLADDELLSVHNEFNVDGNWHPEWRYRKSSIYHHQYLELAFIHKIFHFYWDNPHLLWEIALAKALRAVGNGFSLFLLAAFLFGVYMILGKANRVANRYRIVLFLTLFCLFFLSMSHPQFHLVCAGLTFLVGIFMYNPMKPQSIPFIFPLAILNSCLITLIFYGESRFILVIEPLNIFLSLFIVFLIAQSSYSTGQLSAGNNNSMSGHND